MQGNSSPSATRYEIENKQNKLTFDETPTSGSSNPVTSDGVYTALSNKAGEIVEGKVFNIYEELVTAGIGAERFNAYDGYSVILGPAYDTNVATGDFSHAEGHRTKATGNYSHAEGSESEATNECSYVEGFLSFATGKYSHAEGSSTASGYQAHAEGNSTASGLTAHAEGSSTTASNFAAHSEGYGCTASGYASHAQGHYTEATGEDCHAEGFSTIASNFASHAQGKRNKEMTDGGEYNNKVGDAMVIGNGVGSASLSNCFRVTYAGQVYGLSSFNSSGADYAEYFEWLDGNSENEDRVGYFVTLLGEKIVKAKSTDFILGVVSGQPCIIGNADEDWLGRWEHDEFGRFVKEDTYKLKRDEYGNPIEGEYELDENGNRILNGWTYKQNSDYDASQQYIERKDRKEWSAVGMFGVLAVRDDGTCIVNGYAQVTDLGTATKAEIPVANTYRVIKRVSNNIIKIVFR